MRFSPLQEWSSTSLMIITWLGGLSAQLGAAAGLQENDLKRVVAYSTTSQLGYSNRRCYSTGSKNNTSDSKDILPKKGSYVALYTNRFGQLGEYKDV